MISLDQIMLLEKKVEGAVAKIAQLQAENDALRTRCSELTNALSSKSELLSSFEQDQNRIEGGILKALETLSSIEDSLLKKSGEDSVNVSAPQINPPHAEMASVQQNQTSGGNEMPGSPSAMPEADAPQSTSTATQDYEKPASDENGQFDIF